MSHQKESKWKSDLEIFSKINSILIIEGNIFDRYSKGNQLLTMTEYIYKFFIEQGYKGVVEYDPVMGGFYCIPEHSEPFSLIKFGQACKIIDPNNPSSSNGATITDPEENFCIRAGFSGASDSAPINIKKALSQNKIPIVITLNLASRLICNSGNVSPVERDAFTALLKAGLSAQSAVSKSGDRALKNLCILLVNKVNDLPVWFYHNNPAVKIINVPTPNAQERALFVSDELFKTFFDKDIYGEDIKKYQDTPSELKKLKDKFIGLTDGFTFLELNGLKNLCKINRFHISQFPNLVDFYRFGVTDNPWESSDLKERVKKCNLAERVKGQDVALRKTMEVIKRSITGMSGIQHSSSGSKPRGVLFFAGPTGTGKTETAKSIAELIFGDEKNCIRFDMSEFSQPHSDQRLLGAPPGYVGYEAGGQLTNAVREHPFSILLFDEIEKAHGSILDKFLQILEDGRMTDGQGKTVYFSECIIIFTSNLGISEVDPNNPNGPRKQLVNSSQSYDQISINVKSGIERYFKDKLARPEILNRIGDNIVVFDFIRPAVVEQILRAQLNKIISGLKVEKNISLNITQNAFDSLLKFAKENIENGGRGIGNVVESMLVNPLAEFIFDNEISESDQIEVSNVVKEEGINSIICSKV